MSNAIILAGEYRKLQSKVLASGQTPVPGQLLKLTSAGELTAVHTLGDPSEKIVVLEDALQAGTVNDAYTAGTVVDCGIPYSGSETQALIAAGEEIEIGDKLVVNAEGKLVEATDVAAQTVLAVATEANDLSDSGAEDTLSNVRWL